MTAHPPGADEKILGRLARFAVEPGKPTENDLLCLMILFHTHRLTFMRPSLPSRPNVKQFAAFTQRHAAEIVAAAFPQHTPSELYWMINTAPGHGRFEVMDDVPTEIAIRVLELRSKLLTHPDLIFCYPED
jgi:hypothetical protein